MLPTQHWHMMLKLLSRRPFLIWTWIKRTARFPFWRLLGFVMTVLGQIDITRDLPLVCLCICSAAARGRLRHGRKAEEVWPLHPLLGKRQHTKNIPSVLKVYLLHGSLLKAYPKCTNSVPLDSTESALGNSKLLRVLWHTWILLNITRTLAYFNFYQCTEIKY